MQIATNIQGLFKVGNSFTACNSTEIKINRDLGPSGSVVQGSNSWTAFCDEVDASLSGLGSVKQIYRFVGLLPLSFLIIFITLFVVADVKEEEIWDASGRSDWEEADDVRKQYQTVAGIFVAFFFVSIWTIGGVMHGKVKRTMEAVRLNCVKHSTTQVQYKLSDDRPYMINVDTAAGDTEENLSAVLVNKNEDEIDVNYSPSYAPTYVPSALASAFPLPVSALQEDAATRLQKLEKMKNVLDSETYNKKKAEIMATV